jgi:hypothetical protein
MSNLAIIAKDSRALSPRRVIDSCRIKIPLQFALPPTLPVRPNEGRSNI